MVTNLVDPGNSIVRHLASLRLAKQVPILDLWRKLLPHDTKRHHHIAHHLLCQSRWSTI